MVVIAVMQQLECNQHRKLIWYLCFPPKPKTWGKEMNFLEPAYLDGKLVVDIFACLSHSELQQQIRGKSKFKANQIIVSTELLKMSTKSTGSEGSTVRVYKSLTSRDRLSQHHRYPEKYHTCIKIHSGYPCCPLMTTEFGT